MILPGLGFTILFLLPFIDRRQERHPFKRPIGTAMAFCTLLSLGALLAASYWDDNRNETVKVQLEQQHKDAATFLTTPFTPQAINKPEKQAVASVTAAPPPTLFVEKCAFCHGDAAEGGLGPALNNISKKEKRTREDLIKLIKDPRAYNLIETMPANPEFSQKQCEELTDWILSINK